VVAPAHRHGDAVLAAVPGNKVYAVDLFELDATGRISRLAIYYR
jgi:hypothetical protein